MTIDASNQETVSGGKVYKTYVVETAGNRYSVMLVKLCDSGLFSYLNIRKLTNNPFLSAGKDFYSFDDAVKNYKNPDLKVALLQIETGLI